MVQYNSFFKHKKDMICNVVTSTTAPLKTSMGKERQDSVHSAAGKSVKNANL